MGTEYDPATTRNDVEFSSSNLPIILIETGGKSLTNREKSKASMKVIDNANNLFETSSTLYDAMDENGRINGETRGRQLEFNR